MLICMLMMLPLLPAAEFSDYDITFAKTINDSLMVNDSERFGLDYTGYGYLGDSRTGIYIRAGIQAPFSSLEMIIDNSKEHPGYGTDEDTEKIKNILETSFRFSSALGPAFRSTISDKMIWYMGLGISSSIDYANRRGNVMAAVSYIDISIGVSFDAGFRIDLEENTTIRIGMGIETLLFSISFMTYSSGDGGDELLTKPSLVPYIFLPEEMGKKTKALGYISLGHTFRSGRKDTVYSYRTKDRETGNGVLEVIQ